MASQILHHGRPALAAAWRQDGLDAVAAVPLTGDPDADGQARMLALQQADDAWAGVWLALSAVKQAEATYSAARTAGRAPEEKDLRAALCEMENAVPVRWRILLPAMYGACP